MDAHTLKTVATCQAIQHYVPADFNPHVEIITFIKCFQVWTHLKVIYGSCVGQELIDNSWQGQRFFIFSRAFVPICGLSTLLINGSYCFSCIICWPHLGWQDFITLCKASKLDSRCQHLGKVFFCAGNKREVQNKWEDTDGFIELD
jgi:hypothetical protein